MKKKELVNVHAKYEKRKHIGYYVKYRTIAKREIIIIPFLHFFFSLSPLMKIINRILEFNSFDVQ